MQFQFKNVRSAISSRIGLSAFESHGRRAEANAKYHRGSAALVRANAERVRELLEENDDHPVDVNGELTALRQRGRLLRAQLNLENGRCRAHIHETRKALGKSTRLHHLALAFLHLKSIDQVEDERSSPVRTKNVWLNMLLTLGVDTQGITIKESSEPGKKPKEHFSDAATFEVLYKNSKTRKIYSLTVTYPLFSGWASARGLGVSAAPNLVEVGDMPPRDAMTDRGRHDDYVEVDEAVEAASVDQTTDA